MSFARHFSPSEFSEDPQEHADPKLIERLDDFRDLIGEAIFPSRASGALARFDDADAGSQHYAVGRRSTGVDVFPQGSPSRYWLIAVSCGLWGAVGYYPETRRKGKNWPMLHLDIREPGVGHVKPMPLLWIRVDSQYRYPQYEKAARERLHKALLASG